MKLVMPYEVRAIEWEVHGSSAFMHIRYRGLLGLAAWAYSRVVRCFK